MEKMAAQSIKHYFFQRLHFKGMSKKVKFSYYLLILMLMEFQQLK